MRRTPGKVGSRDCLRGNLEPIPRCPQTRISGKMPVGAAEGRSTLIPSSGNRVNALRLI